MDKKLALRISLNKLENTGIFPNILLSEVLNKKLIQGYILVDNEFSWHVWVEDEMDVVLHLSGFADHKVQYTTFKPIKFEKNDEQVNLYETYVKSPKDYWKLQPKNFKEFKKRYVNKFLKIDLNHK